MHKTSFKTNYAPCFATPTPQLACKSRPFSQINTRAQCIIAEFVVLLLIQGGINARAAQNATALHIERTDYYADSPSENCSLPHDALHFAEFHL